jgi:hypothetical protein
MSHTDITEMCKDCCRVTLRFIYCCKNLYFKDFLLGNFTFYSKVLKAVTCVAPVREAAEEINFATFVKILRSEKNKQACSNK